MSNISRQNRPRLALLASALGVALLTAACGGSSSSTATSPSANGAATGAAHSSPSASSPSASTSGASAVSTMRTGAGKILVDAKGRTMYAFAADTKGHSTCTGSCLTYWPAVAAGATAPKAGAGVTATLGVLHRSDGTAQLTVNGWPMYTYVGDSKPGAASGQGKNLSGGLWWVVSPSGKWITKSGSSGGKAAKATTGHSASGY
jgi:predicted lipoprotein with Yx(FWY)xxD motif